MKRLLSLFSATALILAPSLLIAGEDGNYRISQSLEEHANISYENNIDVSLSNDTSKKVDVNLKVVGGEDVTQTTTNTSEQSISVSLTTEQPADQNGGEIVTEDAHLPGDFEGTLTVTQTETETQTFPALRVDGMSSAVIDNKQILNKNDVANVKNINKAVMQGDALKNAEGNMGANVAAGDNNAQDNLTAIAYTQKNNSFVDAEVYKLQLSVENETCNLGATNDASLGGNALMGAKGNIGANVASGNNNAQSNMTAISVGPSKVGIASAGVKQEAAFNQTSNMPHAKLAVEQAQFSVGINLEGNYAGQSDQIGNLYPDIWTNEMGDSPLHPNGTDDVFFGHVDLDSQAQGAQDLNGDGGALAFNEAGEIALSGTVSGNIPVFFCEYAPTTNTASLTGSALMGAKGNIGVNVAAGTGNLQANGLSISALLSTSGGME